MAIRSESTLSEIQHDALEKILLHILGSSESPLEELKNFRIICKKFKLITTSKRIAKEIPLEALYLQFHMRERFMSLIQICADNENPSALFVLGLEEIAQAGRFQFGIDNLFRAVKQNHKLSAYMCGLILFLHETSRSAGLQMLNEFINTDEERIDCRIKCREYARTMLWRGWSPSLAITACGVSSCGSPSTSTQDNLWMPPNLQQRNYCCDVCKWAHEFHFLVGR